MIYGIDFYKRIKCSEKDKLSLLELLTTLLSFSEKSRREGIFSLIDDIYEVKSYLFQTGINLIIDDFNTEAIREILENYINADGYSGKKFLEQMMILEGIISIKKGENQIFLQSRVLSLFGSESAGKISQKLFENSEETQEMIDASKKAVEEFLNKIKEKKPFSAETAILDEVFSKIQDDRAIQKILRELDNSLLTKALKGCGEIVFQKIWKNMSLRAQHLMADDFDFAGGVYKADVIEAQKNIFFQIQKLEEAGEIVFRGEEDIIY